MPQDSVKALSVPVSVAQASQECYVQPYPSLCCSLAQTQSQWKPAAAAVTASVAAAVVVTAVVTVVTAVVTVVTAAAAVIAWSLAVAWMKDCCGLCWRTGEMAEGDSVIEDWGG